MNISDHELQAYVDRELAPEDVARVEAACAADPQLAARLAREQRLRERVRGGFDGVLDEPVPDRLAALLRTAAGEGAPASANVIPLARRDPAAQTERASVQPGIAASAPPAPDAARRVVPTSPRPRARGGWPAYALAASLAALAVSLWLRPAPGPVVVDDGALVARGALARGLDTALASAPAGADGVAVGLSFRDVDGHVCRSFVLRGDDAMAGLACRIDDRWKMPVVSSVEAVGEGELRQASSAVPPEVQAAIDARLQGDVFDAAQERAARDAGWR
jgi:anti-sigma factor RsiW